MAERQAEQTAGDDAARRAEALVTGTAFMAAAQSIDTLEMERLIAESLRAAVEADRDRIASHFDRYAAADDRAAASARNPGAALAHRIRAEGWRELARETRNDTLGERT